MVATGVEMIIEIVKSDADDPLQGQRKDIKCRLLLSTRPVTADDVSCAMEGSATASNEAMANGKSLAWIGLFILG